ncbi:MAG TPA: hypothetical protein DCX06_11205 [Opitutae bacterium]|nr:hypothetical protein [Opitutae bacterium]HAV14039.1 hypothetical protein [Opitutae bacterium]
MILKPTLHSFDIFDTLLARDIGPPHNIFLILARQNPHLIPEQYSEEAFIHERIRAETDAIVSNNGTDPTFVEIHQHLKRRLSISDQASDELMQHELDLEAKHLQAIPSAKTRIAELRDQGAQIAFISDMYLPVTCIQEELKRHGIFQDGDLLLVSCEESASKHEGALYKKLIALSAKSSLGIRHYGDNKRSDLLSALKNGILPKFLTDGRFNAPEQILAESSSQTAGLSGLFAGVSRFERNLAAEYTQKEQALALVVSNTIAPVLCGFVLSVIHRALDDGCKRLYFLSRDGYILKHIATEMCQALNLSIECNYLHASRLCWELAAIDQINDDAIRHIIQSHLKCSISQVALRVNLDAVTFCKLTNDASISICDEDEPLSHNQITALRHQLQTNESLRSKILKQAAEARALTSDYLLQENVIGDDWAFVDVGWLGTQQRTYMSLGNGKYTQSRGYYIGSLKNSNDKRSQKSGWMFEPNDIERLDTKVELITIIESFCSAPHGSLMEYTRDSDSGMILPESRHANTDALDAFGMPFVRERIMAYNTRLCKILPDFDTSKSLQTCMRKLLLQFIESPSLRDATAWSAVPFESVPTDGRYETIATPIPFSISALWQCIRYGRAPFTNYTKWDSASLRLTSPLLRVIYIVAMSPARFARKSRFMIQLSRKLRTTY